MLDNEIFICLLFTSTVAAQGSTILKPDDGRRNNRINLSLAEAEFEYELEIPNNHWDDQRKSNYRTNNIQNTGNKNSHKTFFDFVTNGIKALYKFSDSDLELFFIIFNDEIKKYHYRGCKFYELTENLNFRKFIARNLLLIKNKPAIFLRRYLRSLHNEIVEAKLDLKKRVLIDLVNELYSPNTVNKFDQIVINLNEYRLRGNVKMNLVKIVRAGIRSALFDYYTELDNDARTKVKVSIDKYLEHNMHINKALRIEMNNTMIRDNKENKTYDNKESMRITPSTKINSLNLNLNLKNQYPINNKIRHTKQRTTVERNPSKFLDVRPVTKEKQIKLEDKMIGRTVKEEYDIAQSTKTSVYGFRNDTQTVDFDQPVSHNTTKVTTRTSHDFTKSQIFKYEIHLNTERKHVKGPKLYLKKPEFQVNFPSLFVGKEIAHIDRPNGKSLVDAPTFNHKNLINVRRMFDLGHVVKQPNRRMGFHPIETIKKDKKGKIIQGRRSLSQITGNATARDTKSNVKIGKINTDNNDQIPKRKELLVDLKFNFDTIKKIITYPFDAIKNAISPSKPKKKVSKIKESKNKTKIKIDKSKKVPMNPKNIYNYTIGKLKYLNTKKFKPILKTGFDLNDYRFTRPYSVDTTPFVFNNFYLTDEKQHDGFYKSTDLDTYLEIEKYVRAIEPQLEHSSTKEDILNVTQKHVEPKIEKGKTLQRLVTGQNKKNLLLENYKTRKNVPDIQNLNAGLKPSVFKDITSGTTHNVYRFTTSIDRFQYLKYLMNTYNNRTNFST